MRLLPQNPLFRLLVKAWLQGCVIAVLFQAGLLAADVGGLRTLIEGAQQPILALVLLFAMLLVTFTSVSMGAAVMDARQREDE